MAAPRQEFASRLGWVVPASGGWTLPGPATDLRLSGLTRHALGGGIRLFHTGLLPGARVRGSAIALAVGSVGASRVDLILPESAAAAEPPRHPEETLELLSPGCTVHLEVAPGPDPDRYAQVGRAREAIAAGRARSWGFGFDPLPSDLRRFRRDLEERPAWVRIPLHLLSPPGATELATIAHETGVAVLASDPFAGGRLNGRWLRDGPLATGPIRRPPDLTRLKQELGPVLRFRPLTEDGSRTLGQVAIQSLGTHPAVDAVLVDAEDLAELEEATAVARLPPLDAEELAQLPWTGRPSNPLRGSAPGVK